MRNVIRRAATPFLRTALSAWRRPTKLTLDKDQPNHLAIQELKETQYLKRPTIRTAKCLTNRIERDHRRITQSLRAMQTFQVFRDAQVTIAGIELAHQSRKEKRKKRTKTHGHGVSNHPWTMVRVA